jgi:hypothetical protein
VTESAGAPSINFVLMFVIAQFITEGMRANIIHACDQCNQASCLTKCEFNYFVFSLQAYCFVVFMLHNGFADFVDIEQSVQL